MEFRDQLNDIKFKKDVELEYIGLEINRLMMRLYLESLPTELNFEQFDRLIKFCIHIKHQTKIKYLIDIGISDQSLTKINQEIERYENLIHSEGDLCLYRSGKTSQIGSSAGRGLYKARVEKGFNKFKKQTVFLSRELLSNTTLSVKDARDLFLEYFPSQEILPKNVTVSFLGTILYTLRPDAFPLVNAYVSKALTDLTGGNDNTPLGYITTAERLDDILKQSGAHQSFAIIDRAVALGRDKGLIISNNQLNESKDGANLNMKGQPLNQILYGAAGTGKTFETINKALEIIEPETIEKYEKVEGGRDEIKKRFDALMAAKRIRFVTFHQSFSYEDFIEGIRAIHQEDGSLSYEPEDGVFKAICTDAIRQPEIEKALHINASPHVWKISMSDDGSRSYCFNHGEARIGWGTAGDLSTEDSYKSEYFRSLGSNNRNTLRTFAEEIQQGDILVCLKSASEISAVGVVTSEYFYSPEAPSGVRSDYRHGRKVNWLFKNISFDIVALNANNALRPKTIYSLGRIKWPDLVISLERAGHVLEKGSKVTDKKLPYVLIIDEINRGNISRIFGELITLIEESKRQGEDEELSVTLPYSKEPFSVPNNVYIIGTMNSSDRSLTGLDVALRRRFVFTEMQPKPAKLNGVVIDGLNIEQLLTDMNDRIEVLLDRDRCIGHAYFMPLKKDETFENLKNIFLQKVLPLLQEYFYDDWERIDWVFNCNGFVTRKNNDLNKLFKAEVTDKLQRHCWEVNDVKFSDISAYQAILGEKK